MASIKIIPAFWVFTDVDGNPLEDGYIYIGEANLDPETNPVNVYSDETLTSLVTQPIRTKGGYALDGTTIINLYTALDYSITVKNKNSFLILTHPSETSSSYYTESEIDALLDLKANLASPTFTGTVGGITKSMVGLSDVDNTSDATKPVSTAQQAAIDGVLTGSKNKIINGQGNINQREYVSGTATAGANEYTLDRWRVVTSGQALTFSTTENVTTFTVPVGGFEQEIEGLNLISGTHTVSFVPTGDTICTVDGVAKVSGDTFTLIGGANSTIVFSSVLGTGTVKLIQVEYGDTATNFEQRLEGVELSLCQRYYEVSDATTRRIGYEASASLIYIGSVDYKQVKRVVPTITYSGYSGSGYTAGAIGINLNGIDAFFSVDTTASGGTAGHSCFASFSWISDAEL